VVSGIEGTVKVLMTLAKEGPAGLWEWIKDKVAEIDIQGMVLGAIKDFVITRIITAGVTWLIGLLNPAAGFIKACKAIYDIIMFFIERGSQIMEFVNSVLDSIGAIATGNIGAAANLVENSLAKILPLAISFLASLLGLDGIGEKIKQIIEKIRAPITKLVTAVLTPILKPFKKLFDKGANFVKGVVAKGKALGSKAIDSVKAKAGAVGGKLKGLVGGKDKAAQPAPEQKPATLDAAVAESERVLGAEDATPEGVKAQLPAIKARHNLASLTLVSESGGNYHVSALISRQNTSTKRLDKPPSITLVRPERFWKSTREALQKLFPRRHEKGDGAYVKDGMARRHIISSQEMLENIENRINKCKTLSEAAKLLKSKGCPPAEPISNKRIQSAAQKLLRMAFNCAENLWVGDSSENSSLQDARDFPDAWNPAKRAAHVRLVKTRYLFES
jgi:hypothetical protein